MLFGAGDALKGLVGFLLIPLYTRYLTPSDYGYLALITVSLSILSGIGCQGMSAAFFRSYAFLGREGKDIADLVSTSYNYLLLTSIVLCTLLYINAGAYSGLLFDSGDSEILIRLGAAIVFAQIVSTIPFAYMRARLKTFKYITYTLLQFLLQCSLNIVFLVGFGMEVAGVLLGNALSTVAIALISVESIGKHLKPKVSGATLSGLLRFGLPIVVVSLSVWVMHATDRFLLAKLSSATELGLYSLGSNFASVITILLVAPFRKVWAAFQFQVAAGTSPSMVFRVVTTYFLLLLCTAGAMLIVWIQPVLELVAGREFWGAHKVVAPLVVAHIAHAMVLMLTLGMQIQKKTHYVSYIVGAGAAANIGLNLFLIPRYGMLGAAFASIASYVSVDVLSYFMSQRLYPIPFDKPRLAKIGLIFFLVAIAGYSLRASNVMLDFLYRVFLMAAFFLLLLKCDIVGRNERDKLRKFATELAAIRGIAAKISYVVRAVAK